MTSLSELPIRDDLRGRSPYGAPQRPVPVALNVNENTHPVPEDVAADIVSLNGLDSAVVSPGQQLAVPTKYAH